VYAAEKFKPAEFSLVHTAALAGARALPLALAAAATLAPAATFSDSGAYLARLWRTLAFAAAASSAFTTFRPLSAGPGSIFLGHHTHLRFS